jgi:hypothetical protein
MSVITKINCDICNTEVTPQEIDITYYKNADDKMEMYSGCKGDMKIIHKHICERCLLQIKEMIGN